MPALEGKSLIFLPKYHQKIACLAYLRYIRYLYVKSNTAIVKNELKAIPRGKALIKKLVHSSLHSKKFIMQIL
jgi:hypothetical protein